MKKLILLAVTAVLLSTAGAAVADGHRHKQTHGYHEIHHVTSGKHRHKRHWKKRWKKHWKRHLHHHRPYHGHRHRWPRYGYGHRAWRYDRAYRPVPIPRLLRQLRRHHYHGFERVRLHDGHYRVHAYDRHRRPVRLIVDAYTGVVVAWRGRR